jgi:hypothetical protein
MSDFRPGDTVKLTGTGSEGTVVEARGNSVTVKLARGTITTSAFQVQLVKAAAPAKKAAKPKRRK